MRSSGKADHRGQPPGCKERRRMDLVGGSKSNQHREVSAQLHESRDSI